MKISGRTIDATYLIGRRFAWTHQQGHPEFTCVSYKRGDYMGSRNVELVCAHATDGGVQWLQISTVLNCLKQGILIEAAGAPFTNRVK